MFPCDRPQLWQRSDIAIHGIEALHKQKRISACGCCSLCKHIQKRFEIVVTKLRRGNTSSSGQAIPERSVAVLIVDDYIARADQGLNPTQIGGKPRGK